ncbi:AraC family transcriptional regulator [Chitinophaga sp.]|uniref:AraC family transcriptional regulator n=1 Tax=Chitinophaga sp. TaxID=1869181 RepID=UPI002624FD91|nr:AraC family transcriptional regulator [uncultured Chitinophaga sp.]
MKSQNNANNSTAWTLPEQLQRKLDVHPLGRNLYITAIRFYPENDVKEWGEPKGAPVYSLLYSAHGGGWYEADGKRFPVKANQYVLLAKNTPFRCGPDPRNPWRLYTAQFTGLLADELCDYLTNGKPMHTTPPLVGRIAQFWDIVHHLDLMNNIENLLYANFRFYSFLGTFRLSVFNYMKQGSDNQIEQCIQIMKQQLDKNLTLADLAAQAHLSASYLSALFKEKTRYSPIQLYTSLRMQKASQLLQETHLTVKEIAQEMGYPDQYTFSRTFKGIMGVSPKGFREKS